MASRSFGLLCFIGTFTTGFQGANKNYSANYQFLLTVFLYLSTRSHKGCVFLFSSFTVFLSFWSNVKIQIGNIIFTRLYEENFLTCYLSIEYIVNDNQTMPCIINPVVLKATARGCCSDLQLTRCFYINHKHQYWILDRLTGKTYHREYFVLTQANNLHVLWRDYWIFPAWFLQGFLPLLGSKSSFALS